VNRIIFSHVTRNGVEMADVQKMFADTWVPVIYAPPPTGPPFDELQGRLSGRALLKCSCSGLFAIVEVGAGRRGFSSCLRH
jgi:hypothetical protein